MGVRGLVGFIFRDGTRKGFYNRFDSGPGSLGQDIQDFMLTLNQEDLWEMGILVEAITWLEDLTRTPLGPVPVDCQGRYREYGLSDVSDFYDTTRPNWTTVLGSAQGAKCLPAIKSRKLKHLLEDTDFAHNGGCQWAYFIDFWNEKLEVWAEGAACNKTFRYQN